jgi:hypothetical protein
MSALSGREASEQLVALSDGIKPICPVSVSEGILNIRRDKFKGGGT